MIFPGFPGVLSFFQVFQVEWEPWLPHHLTIGNTNNVLWVGGHLSMYICSNSEFREVSRHRLGPAIVNW